MVKPSLRIDTLSSPDRWSASEKWSSLKQAILPQKGCQNTRRKYHSGALFAQPPRAGVCYHKGDRLAKPFALTARHRLWRKQYSGISRDQLRQLKELRQENARHRLAELSGPRDQPDRCLSSTISPAPAVPTATSAGRRSPGLVVAMSFAVNSSALAERCALPPHATGAGGQLAGSGHGGHRRRVTPIEGARGNSGGLGGGE